MPKLTTLVTPLTIATTGMVALAGCSSSSSAAHSSASTAPSSSATSSAAAGSSSAAASSPAAAASLGSVITPLATKLGCSNPVVKKPQPAAGAALGASAGINCAAGSNQYVLLQLKPGGSAATAAKGLLAASGTKSGSVYYVAGPQWMAVGGPASTNTPPTKQDAQAVQAKIGGSVGSVSA